MPKQKESPSKKATKNKKKVVKKKVRTLKSHPVKGSISKEAASKASKVTSKKVAVKSDIVQVKNPKTDRYVKIDRTSGKILSTKKSDGAYKGIPIARKKSVKKTVTKKTKKKLVNKKVNTKKKVVKKKVVKKKKVVNEISEKIISDLEKKVKKKEAVKKVKKKRVAKVKPPKKPRKRKYLNNRDLMEQVMLSKENGMMSDKLAHMLTVLCARYGRKGQFGSYTYNDDMQAYAMMMLVKTWNSFNPEKSNNPFAFFTQCIKNSFIQFLNQERKQRDVRDVLLVNGGMLPSHTYMSKYEDQMEQQVAERKAEEESAEDPIKKLVEF